jgi:hypothetical protein
MAVDLSSILELWGGGIFTMKRRGHRRAIDAGERGQDECSGGLVDQELRVRNEEANGPERKCGHDGGGRNC